MSTWAAPGVKCVCIGKRDRIINDLGIRGVPAVGEVCIIAAVDLDATCGVIIRLQGYDLRQWFGIAGFRPLAYQSQSLEADLAKFKQVGRHVRAPEKERA